LDIGCGSGYRLLEILDRGEKLLVGGDINVNNLMKISEKIKIVTQSIFFTGFDAVKMPFKDGAFDVVLCNLVLAYVKDDMVVLNEISRILKPGGSLLLRTTSLGFYLKRVIDENISFKIHGIAAILSTILYHIIGVKFKRDTFHMPGRVTRLLKVMGIETKELTISEPLLGRIPGAFNVVGHKLRPSDILHKKSAVR
jgi:SAM-dependent methyltransferase